VSTVPGERQDSEMDEEQEAERDKRHGAEKDEQRKIRLHIESPLTSNLHTSLHFGTGNSCSTLLVPFSKGVPERVSLKVTS